MDADADAVLGALREKFLARAAEDLLALKSTPAPAELAVLVHRLAGAGGVFGFPEVSAAAMPLDEACHAGREPPADGLRNLISALEALPSPR